MTETVSHGGAISTKERQKKQAEKIYAKAKERKKP